MRKKKDVIVAKIETIFLGASMVLPYTLLVVLEAISMALSNDE
jgi:hypothetical protein